MQNGVSASHCRRRARKADGHIDSDTAQGMDRSSAPRRGEDGYSMQGCAVRRERQQGWGGKMQGQQRCAGRREGQRGCAGRREAPCARDRARQDQRSRQEAQQRHPQGLPQVCKKWPTTVPTQTPGVGGMHVRRHERYVHVCARSNVRRSTYMRAQQGDGAGASMKRGHAAEV